MGTEDWNISSNDCGYSYSTTLENKLCGKLKGKVCSYANCPLKVSVERVEVKCPECHGFRGDDGQPLNACGRCGSTGKINKKLREE